MSGRMWQRLVGRSRPARDDSGAILIFAIIIVTVVAVVIGAVLTRGDGSLRATIALRQVAGATYAADGAAQVAINALRTGYHAGSDEPADWVYTNGEYLPGKLEGCFGWNGSTADSTLELKNFYPAPKSTGGKPNSAYVTCEPEGKTGAQGPAVPINNSNKPGNAILTLGQSASERGLESAANAANALRVHGSIHSNSDILVSSGQLIASEDVTAQGNCTRSAIIANTTCPGGGILPDPAVAAPARYAYDTTPTTLVPQSVPTTCASLLTFSPGYYDDAKALTDLMSKNQCSNTTYWFKPGPYYFDFHNNPSDPMYDADTNSGGGTSAWTIKRGNLIAGQPVGNSLASPVFPDEGNCVNPIDDVAAEGVQFIFGGDSRLVVDGTADVEICGSYHSDRPPLAIYGMRTGNLAKTVLGSTPGADGPALRTSGAPGVTNNAPSTFVGATAATLQDAGNGSAVWTRGVTPSGSPNANNTITMNGFAPGSPIPMGTVLKEARLVVRHKSASGTTGTPSTIQITPSGGSALGAFDLARQGTLATQTVDLRASQGPVFDALQKSIYANGYTGASVAFRAYVGPSQSAELDSVQLELEYYKPQFRAQDDGGLGATNCLNVGGGCRTVTVGPNGGSFNGVVYIQGTTYAPKGAVYINLANNQEAQVFKFGVISRSLYFNTQGNPSFTGDVIELPDNSPGFGVKNTIVRLTVYLCDQGGPCDGTSGKLALRSRVQLWDPDGVATKYKRAIRIMSWSHTR